MHEPLFSKKTSRRAFLRLSTLMGTAALLQACAPAPPPAQAPASPAPATTGPAAVPTATGAVAGARATPLTQTLLIAIDSDPQSLDPSTNLAYPVGSEIILNVFDTLVAWKPPTFDTIEGRLAERWEVSPDARSYTFAIRSAVTFHDGTVCDAPAIKAAMERVKADNSFMTAYYGPIESIEAPDARTLRITLKEPSAVFLSWLAMPQAAIHSPTNAQQWTKEQIGAHPVGSGPFKFESYTQNTEVILSANPDYFRGAPALQRIAYRVIPDQATRRLELEQGSVDVVQQNGNLFSLPVADIAALRGNGEVRVLEFDSQIVRYIQFNNTDSELMKDKRVRQAISLAVDYDGLLSGVLGGTATRLYGPLPISNWAALPNIQDLAPKRDVAQARQLLQEAGKTNLDLMLYTFQGSSWRDIGTFIQANLREAGINVQVVQMEFPALREQITSGRFDFSLGGRQPWYNDPDGLLTIDYLSSLGPTALTFRMPENAELDGLLLRAQRGGSQEERKQLYHEVQRRLMDYVPGVYLFNPKIIVYTRANVQDLVPNTAPPLTEYFQVKKG